jgi:riboflavin transporter FmnP
MLKAVKLNQSNRMATVTLVKISLLSTIAVVLMLLEFGTGIFPSFLKFEFSDVPAVIGTLSFGPAAGVLIELLKNLLKLMIKGTSTGGVGELANFLVGVAYILPIGILYKYKKSNKWVLLGMVISVVAMAVSAGVLNYYIMLPLYSKFMPLEAIIEQSAVAIPAINSTFTLILYGITPFNVIKGIAISVVGYILYKSLKNRL